MFVPESEGKGRAGRAFGGTLLNCEGFCVVCVYYFVGVNRPYTQRRGQSRKKYKVNRAAALKSDLASISGRHVAGPWGLEGRGGGSEGERKERDTHEEGGEGRGKERRRGGGEGGE